MYLSIYLFSYFEWNEKKSLNNVRPPDKRWIEDNYCTYFQGLTYRKHQFSDSHKRRLRLSAHQQHSHKGIYSSSTSIRFEFYFHISKAAASVKLQSTMLFDWFTPPIKKLLKNNARWIIMKETVEYLTRSYTPPAYYLNTRLEILGPQFSINYRGRETNGIDRFMTNDIQHTTYVVSASTIRKRRLSRGNTGNSAMRILCSCTDTYLKVHINLQFVLSNENTNQINYEFNLKSIAKKS